VAETVEEYIRAFPEEVQVVLEEVRRRIRHAVPGVAETIKYQMPTMTLDGTSLVHFAAWKRHLSVYPIPAGDAAFERAIQPYRAGEGTARFAYAEPIPYDLIERMATLFRQQRGAQADRN